MISAAVILVAALHVGFFVLESVLWTTPRVRKIFGNDAEQAQVTRVLALNQGAHNLGLAVLLLGFLLLGEGTAVAGTLLFIVAMGVVGAVSASPAILWLQAAPALAALGLIIALG
jgi:putative membrane protein